MGFLTKILGKDQAKAPAATPVVCLHSILLPRWDSIEDMGKEDRATGFTCQSCGEMFTKDEAAEVERTALERLHAANV